MNNAFQRIVEEQFTTEPHLEVEESRSPIEEKRHHRFSAATGPLRVRYSATVELSHQVQSPAMLFNLTPPDFHAHFEAYLDGRWYIFGATRLAPQTSFIRIGTGRDAADTSFATFFGPVAFSGMKITMQPAGEHVPVYTADAISTS